MIVYSESFFFFSFFAEKENFYCKGKTVTVCIMRVLISKFLFYFILFKMYKEVMHYRSEPQRRKCNLSRLTANEHITQMKVAIGEKTTKACFNLFIFLSVQKHALNIFYFLFIL